MEYLNPYNPTWRDRLANAMLGQDPSYVRKNFVEGLLGSRGMGPTGMGVVDATPIGGLLAAQEAAKGGDYRGAAMAMMPMGGVLNREAKALGREAAAGIRAYHGSPYDFDRFDISKIGAGEGAQAFGHGLYFAEKERIAKGYRDALSSNKFRYENVQPDAEATQKFSDLLADIQSRRSQLVDKDGFISLDASADDLKSLATEEDKVRNMMVMDTINRNPHVQYGRMYEVNIKADPSQFLDWDKPLSEQSEQVRRAIADMRELGMKVPSDDSITGADFYRAIANQKAMKSGLGFGPEGAKATNDLKFAGVPGIKYLDGGSRAAGEGSRNYVVFDDTLVDILRKYGLIGMLGGGAAYGVMQPDSAQAATK